MKKLYRDAGSASRRNAPWLHPAAPRLRPAAAVLAILGVYLLGWADGIGAAVWYLVDHTRTQLTWRQFTSEASSYVQYAAGLIAVVLLSCRLLLRRWPFHLGHTRTDLRAEATCATLFLAAFAGSVEVMNGISHLLNQPPTQYPFPTSTPSVTLTVLSSALAGPTEELFFCVFVTVVARTGGLRMRHAIALSALLRLGFHIYYGWPSIALLGWAITAVTLYALNGRIIGIIVMHSAWDLLGTSVAYNWPIPAILGALVVFGIPLSAALTARRGHKTATREPGTDPVQSTGP